MFTKIHRILITAALSCVVAGQVGAVSFQETHLGRMPAANIQDETALKMSAQMISTLEAQGFALDAASCNRELHGSHVAAVVPTPEGKCKLWLDGKFGPVYDQIRHAVKGAYNSKEFRFSPDGSHIAYTARKGNKWVMVVDGVESPLYDSLREPCFSLDGKNLCYVAFRNNKSILVINGKESKEYYGIMPRYPYVLSRSPYIWVDDTYCPFVMSDSGKIGYVASNGKLNGVDQEFAVIDGKPGPVYERIGPMEFTRDGSRCAYAARKNNKEFVVLDGKPGPKYDSVTEVRFSPDGKRFAYIANRFDANSDPHMRVVADGKEGPSHHDIMEISLDFSPDSKHLTYTAEDGEKYFVVMDGKTGPTFDEVGGSNGEIYVTFGPDGHTYYRAKRGEKCHMVVDSVASPAYDEVSPYPLFSQDGSHAVYIGRVKDRDHAICDGVKGPAYAVINGESLSFTKDGKLVYQACKPDSDSYFAVIGDTEHPEIPRLFLSKDGKYSAYQSIDENDYMNKMCVLYGGAKSGQFSEVLPIIFHEDGTLEFLAVRNNITESGMDSELYRVIAK